MCLQVAMVQFTDDPRTEFKLDAYKTKETLLDAIRHISYKGGNTKTGKTQAGKHLCNSSQQKLTVRPKQTNTGKTKLTVIIRNDFPYEACLFLLVEEYESRALHKPHRYFPLCGSHSSQDTRIFHWCNISVPSFSVREITCGVKRNCWFFVSGKAIKYVRDTLFTAESGTRRGIPKVIVVITDGRSQDDVNKISREMQADGNFLYAPSWLLRTMLAPSTHSCRLN